RTGASAGMVGPFDSVGATVVRRAPIEKTLRLDQKAKKCRRGGGGTTAAVLKTGRQPGEGDEAAAILRPVGGGRAYVPDFGGNCRCLAFGSRNMAIQGHEHYKCVTSA